jgi:hypothetical protein
MSERYLDAETTNFMMAIGLQRRRVRAAVASQDLSWTRTTMLARLDKDGPATTVAALERLGLVTRKPHRTDDRQLIVALTAKGAALRKKARDEKRTWLAQAVAALDRQDRKTLFAAGEIIKRLVGNEPR